MKKLLLIGTFMLAALTSVSTFAYTGWCQTQGGPQMLNFTFDATITDINQAAAGTQINDVYQWDIPGTFSVKCDQEPGTLTQTYFKAKSDLPVTHTDSNGAFYKVNQYLSAQAQIYIWNSGGNYYHYVPFTDIGNHTNSDHSDWNSGWGSGTQGKVNIYIDRKMAQSTTIPMVTIAELYASMQQGSYGGEPIAELHMGGQIHVPQNCVINAGNRIAVDFGDMYNTDFVTKGAKPASGVKKNITIPIKCSNIEASANLTLTFIGKRSADEPDALQSTNHDVGFMIFDDKNNVIPPDAGKIPFHVNNDVDETAEVNISVMPVSTTGNVPSEGAFQAVAEIRVDFA